MKNKFHIGDLVEYNNRCDFAIIKRVLAIVLKVRDDGVCVEWLYKSSLVWDNILPYEKCEQYNNENWMWKKVS